MTQTLDEERDYGYLTPPFRGAFYEQGGNYFGSDKAFKFSINPVTGVHSGKMLTPASLKKEKEVISKKPENVKAAAEIVPDTSEQEDKAKKLDFDAWMQGDITVAFYEVRKALKEQYPDAPTLKSAKEIKAYLKSKGRGN